MIITSENSKKHQSNIKHRGEIKLIKDSGNRRHFDSGAVRDIQEGKGRCDLMPLREISDLIDYYAAHVDNSDMENYCAILDQIATFLYTDRDFSHIRSAIYLFVTDVLHESIWSFLLRLSRHYEGGAIKYGERNWEKGIPAHSFVDSAIRHLLKFANVYTDEAHDLAFVWNLLGLEWTLVNLPEFDDICTSLSVDSSIDNNVESRVEETTDSVESEIISVESESDVTD